MSTRNRRHHFRVAVQLRGTCHVIDRTGLTARSLDVDVVNLSSSGVRIVADEPLWAPQAVRLELHSADPELDVSLSGRVVRGPDQPDGRFAFGVRFEGVAPAMQVALTRFVFAEAKRTGQSAERVTAGWRWQASA